MANNGKSRLVWIIAALVVFLVLLLLWIRRPGDGDGNPRPTPAPTAVVVITATATPLPQPTPTCVPFGMGGGSNKNVAVGPDIAVCNPDCISIQSTDTITWTGNTGGTNGVSLWIEFDEKPFQNMYQQANRRWRTQCSTLTCTSGAVVGTALSGWYPCGPSNGQKCKDFKYWQIFHDWPGGDKVADGRIIIRW